MVKIRLLRAGAKKQAKYRIVVVDENRKRDGGFIEIVGHYNPTSNPPEVGLKMDRVHYWLSVGAKPTKSITDIVKRYERVNRVSS
jgi:small subunit ribosomal protein S16